MIGRITLSINIPDLQEREEQKGIIPKDISFDEVPLFIASLSMAVQALVEEHRSFILEVVLSAYPQGQQQSILPSVVKPHPERTDPLLSRREKEVLNLMFDGLTNKEIAQKLFISLETVKSHRKHILDKTGSKNTAAIFKCLKLPGIDTLTR